MYNPHRALPWLAITSVRKSLNPAQALEDPDKMFLQQFILSFTY